MLGLDASPYGRRVVARFPEMVRKLAAYTRHGFDQDAAVLRCYLPAVAGHNLLMGAELALAEGQGDRDHDECVPLAEASSPGSIAERLQKRTSLRFARENVEAALDMLVRGHWRRDRRSAGQDLQLDGITRNQIVRHRRCRHAGRRRFWSKSCGWRIRTRWPTGPADPRQKLVYVIGPERGGPGGVFITTRAKAAGARRAVCRQAFQPESRQLAASTVAWDWSLKRPVRRSVGMV